MPRFCVLSVLFFFFFSFRAEAFVSWIIADPDGKIIASRNADTPMLPASILKIPTSLYALNTLGADHVFSLAWSVDTAGNLVIRGNGDPALTSVPLKTMVEGLAKATSMRKFTGLVVDISRFDTKSLVVDGAIASSIRTYNSPIAPFGVNFNAICFKKQGGKILSCEEETPFLAMAEGPARRSGLSNGRIPMPHEGDFPVRYAAALARYFLEDAGFFFAREDTVIRRQKPKNQETLLYLAPSPFTLAEVVQMLMRYSNNFIANQLLLATSLEREKDGFLTAEEARKNLEIFLKDELKLSSFTLEEASGLSRKNKISAGEMLKTVQAFSPYMELLRKDETCGGWYKTGTLSNVRTRAGFFRGPKGWYPYVLMTQDENNQYEGQLKSIREKIERGQ